MGGWLISWGNQPSEDPWTRFRSTFRAPNLPQLNCNRRAVSNGLEVLTWAWNESEIPDVTVVDDAQILTLVCGVITDMGRFGPVDADPTKAASTVASLWRKHSKQVLDELNGSFSLAIVDQDKGRAELCTDRFASRSIWSGCDGERWVIGNVPSAVAASFQSTPQHDLVGMWSMLTAGRPVGEHGIHRGIKSLMAGRYAELRPNGHKSVSHWFSRKYEPDTQASTSVLGKRLAEKLRESANRYKRVCGEPHLFLSGGMDSRLVAAAFGEKLKCLTLCTNSNMESKIASAVSHRLGLDHETCIRSPYWYLDTMEANSLICGGNYLVGHCHFTIPTLRALQTNPNAEFFLGDMMENLGKHYFSAENDLPRELSESTLPEFLSQNSPAMLKFPERAGIYLRHELRDEAEQSYRRALYKVYESFEHTSSHVADRLDCLLRWGGVSATYSFSMLVNFWPIAKERNIYFDTGVDDASLQISAKVRSSQVLHALILKNLSRKLAWIPDANSFLPPGMPLSAKRLASKARPMLGRARRAMRKSSSSTPNLNTSGSWLLTHELYRKDEKYRTKIAQVMESHQCFPPETFDNEAILRTWSAYLKGDTSRHFEVEGLLSIGMLNRLLAS